MSRATDAGQSSEGWDSLRDVFHKEISENGGDSAKAFIATLDELDARMGVSDEQVAQNTLTFEALATWLKITDDQLKGMPQQIDNSTARGVGRLSAATELAAGKGAREGAMASQTALETLRRTVEAYEARRQQITRRAALGLPLVFSAALIAAFLFASFVIPALPRGWQWPCTFIGAEFRTNIDENSPITFCVIVRE
ncbi:hypothetical protein [Sedimentitalea todarodis]|uniref:Uncharacterized protein n=1 Tax=Sedimentitalea todarodis TaxID=1631240 RepID=A0ABU3VLE6_9RHOB|nr:hypothetical protein [Sedimentitalea todarodis]MDU9007009.1 hypothetical protein [Sedimentitalea todarodis]